MCRMRTNHPEPFREIRIAKRVVAASPSPRRVESRADELDRVLDKISQQGIDSLTSDERHVLEEMSKRLRGRES